MGIRALDVLPACPLARASKSLTNIHMCARCLCRYAALAGAHGETIGVMENVMARHYMKEA